MAIFNYEVRDRLGQIKKGTIAAVSYDHAAKKLVAAGNELITIHEAREGVLERFQGVKKREVISFTRGLSILQKAGVPMLESLNSLMEMAGKTKMGRVEQDIIMGVESGLSFSEALDRFPKVFERLYVAMVKVAEASGKLPEILERLHKVYETEEDLKSQLKSAMAYPIVVAMAIAGIITFILTFVVPKFVKTFSSLGVTLPVPTQMLIKVSNFLRGYYFIIIPGVILIFFAINRIVKIGQIKVAYDGLKLNLPVVGGLVQKTVLARFAKGLQILLESGVPIMESLGLVGSAVGNEIVSRNIKQMSDYISTGGKMTDFVKMKKMFPLLVTQMISVGENSGNLDTMFGEIAAFYETETQRALKTLISILEPVMIVVMGLAVGGILIMLMMPLFTMMKGFKI